MKHLTDATLSLTICAAATLAAGVAHAIAVQRGPVSLVHVADALLVLCKQEQHTQT